MVIRKICYLLCLTSQSWYWLSRFSELVEICFVQLLSTFIHCMSIWMSFSQLGSGNVFILLIWWFNGCFSVVGSSSQPKNCQTLYIFLSETSQDLNFSLLVYRLQMDSFFCPHTISFFFSSCHITDGFEFSRIPTLD